MKTNLFIWLMLLPLIGFASSGDSPFHQGGFIAAKQQAKTERKLQLLEFVADWCLPCKHMDQTTFKDPMVMEYLKENFVSVKVDIDQFDGFALKQEFSVKYLPTIIVLDNQGNMVHMIEEALSASQLINSLSEVTSAFYRHSPKAKLSEMVAPSIEANQQDLSRLSVKSLEVSEVKTFSPDQNNETVEDKPMHKPEHVMLQFGVFGNEKNADRLYDKVTSFLPSAPEIKTIERDGRSLYKIQYGPFRDTDEAKALQSMLKNEGINSLIKKLE